MSNIRSSRQFPGTLEGVLRTAKPDHGDEGSCREQLWSGLFVPNAGSPPPLSESASDQRETLLRCGPVDIPFTGGMSSFATTFTCSIYTN